jgi:signal peptidase I
MTTRTKRVLIALVTLVGGVGSAAPIVVLLRFGRWRIPQDGMAPGLPAGKAVWGHKKAYTAPADVRRGDVVIFRRVLEGVAYDYVWRVIGLPGERLAIRDDVVLVDDRPLPRRPLPARGGRTVFEESAGPDRRYAVAAPASPGPKSQMAPLVVPADSFFLLGDNRHGAADSRDHGPVPFAAILARAWE